VWPEPIFVLAAHGRNGEIDVQESSKLSRSMRTNTRPLIEDRPPQTSDRAVVFTVVLGITVLSLLLFTGLLFGQSRNVHAGWFSTVLNSRWF
jgi:hypothetical protein